MTARWTPAAGSGAMTEREARRALAALACRFNRPCSEVERRELPSEMRRATAALPAPLLLSGPVGRLVRVLEDVAAYRVVCVPAAVLGPALDKLLSGEKND